MPGYQTTTVNWDTIRSITHPKVAKKISDNITAKIPVIYYLDKQGNKEMEYGGMNYVIPVMKDLGSGQAYTGNEVLTSAEPDAATVAIYERKQLTAPIEATGTKMLQNTGKGEESIVDYLTFLVEVAQEKMKDMLGGDTYGIFSTNNESDKGVTGLPTMFGANANTLLTTGTVGGLSRADNAWWRQKAYSIVTGFNTTGLLGMRGLFYDCTRGDETPNLIVMNQATFTNFDRTLTNTISNDIGRPFNTEVAEAMFPTLKFRGADVVFDSYCPANTFFMLNLKYLKLLVHADRDMTIREWITPTNQDAILARIYWAGNLICSNLSRQGMAYTLPDTWA